MPSLLTAAPELLWSTAKTGLVRSPGAAHVINDITSGQSLAPRDCAARAIIRFCCHA